MDSKISGEIKFKDYLNAFLYGHRYLFLLLISLETIVVFIVIPSEILTLWEKVLFYVIPPLSLGIAYYLCLVVIARRNYTTTNKRFYKRVIKLTEKNIEYSMKENQGHIPWSDIKKVVLLKSMILLHVRKSSPIIIPKHFFSSSTQKKEWITFIKQHVPN